MAFIEPGDMLTGAPLPGWSGRFFHSASMTFAQWDISADAADLHEHHHEQEEVWNVVEGEVVLTVGGESSRLGAGCAAVVPPDTPHSVRVVGAARVIVTDYPRREQLPGSGHRSS